ncbi:MAG: carbon starvation protein A [Bdellovibrio sp.]|nr:carbon starvation protein A [Bdellovibrio sp.]
MSVAILTIVFIAFLVAGYWTYGRWVAGHFDLSATRQTPANKMKDGIDFVPTHPFYLFGQHFSAIAAAGPIAGPIIAAVTFGWLPGLLWIAFGVIFIGAVHDFSSLVVSVKHGACSIAELARTHISRRAGLALMGFILISLVYIIVAFGDVTASSFVYTSEELQAVHVNFHPGGAVAAASVYYLCLCFILGLIQKFLKLPLWLISIIFPVLVIVTSWAGTMTSQYFLLDMKTWAILIALYCALGSMLPTWMLLQPRGFLGGFVLYFALAIGLIGLLFGGHTIQLPPLKEGVSWFAGTTGMFPFLFVTIACGACSGFHGLVCSGTTSKQIDKETHTHPIGYGAMLSEALVAFIALAVVMVQLPEGIKGMKPGTIYGKGLGDFLTMLVGEKYRLEAMTFGAMAFSTFVFDTIDVATRLGRYLIQELTGLKGWFGSFIGTWSVVIPAGLILYFSSEGSWAKFWGLFGASNQLLAALTLLTITVWIKESKRPIYFTLIPMLFVLTMTLLALGGLFYDGIQKTHGFDLLLVITLTSSILIILAGVVALESIKRVRA